MLVLGSVLRRHSLLPRLLSQRLIVNIGRKPRHQEWLVGAAGAAAGQAASPHNPSSYSSNGGSSRRKGARANSGQVPGASRGFHKTSDSHVQQPGHESAASAAQEPQQQLLQPQPLGSFSVTAKELAGQGKVRLDAYLSAHLPDASRAKLSASIKAGLVSVNRAVVCKPSYTVKAGDVISAALLPPEPCMAIPEAIPLDVVYEDDHLIVVNKAPGMVVHLSPGHTTGTLVNALLAHCGLPACDAVPCGSSSGGGLLPGQAAGGVLGGVLQEDDLDEAEEEAEAEMGGEEENESPAVPGPSSAAAAAATRPGLGAQATQQQQQQPGRSQAAGAVSSSGSSSNSGSGSNTGSSGSNQGIIRPGIVHRLDRGTSGLMVVAKTDATHAALCQQFKERSVSRIYNSITVGVPAPQAARVATNVTRDPGNRLRMMAVQYGSARGRTAASNYQTLEVLAAGGAAVVQWRLETGRTHQIRVHAKHVGHPLLGDDVYGPSYAAAARQVIGKRSSLAAAAKAAVEGFGRPALHAKTLGFTHPVTQQRLEFDSEWPADFLQLYRTLKECS